MNKINKKDYKKIVNQMPIAVIDFIIDTNNNIEKNINCNLFYNDISKYNILLVKRKNNPLKNKWWIPGGRIFKNEDINEAGRRILKEELNLNPVDYSKLEFIGYYNGKFSKSEWGVSTHTISLLFWTKLFSQTNISLDNQSSRFKSGSIPNKLITYFKKTNQLL